MYAAAHSYAKTKDFFILFCNDCVLLGMFLFLSRIIFLLFIIVFRSLNRSFSTIYEDCLFWMQSRHLKVWCISSSHPYSISAPLKPHSHSRHRIIRCLIRNAWFISSHVASQHGQYPFTARRLETSPNTVSSLTGTPQFGHTPLFAFSGAG